MPFYKCPNCLESRPGIEQTPWGSLRQCTVCKGKGVLEDDPDDNYEWLE